MTIIHLARKETPAAWLIRSLFISGLLRIRERFYPITYHHIPGRGKMQVLSKTEWGTMDI